MFSSPHSLFQFQTVYIRRQDLSWAWIEVEACIICSNSIGCTYSFRLHWGWHWFSMQSNQQQLRLKSTQICSWCFFVHFTRVESILITRIERLLSCGLDVWKPRICIHENESWSVVQYICIHFDNCIWLVSIQSETEPKMKMTANDEKMSTYLFQYYERLPFSNYSLLRSKSTCNSSNLFRLINLECNLVTIIDVQIKLKGVIIKNLISFQLERE